MRAAPIFHLSTHCLLIIAICMSVAGCRKNPTVEILEKPNLANAREVKVDPVDPNRGGVSAVCRLPEEFKPYRFKKKLVLNIYRLSQNTQIDLIIQKLSSKQDPNDVLKEKNIDSSKDRIRIEINGWRGFLEELNDNPQIGAALVYVVKDQHYMRLAWTWDKNENRKNEMTNAAGCVLWTIKPQ
jgi:hypothetical protein